MLEKLQILSRPLLITHIRSAFIEWRVCFVGKDFSGQG